MEDFESKLGSILSNPEMMGKIMSIAQSMGGGQSQPEPPRQEAAAPDFDFATLQKLTGLMEKATVDPQQKALLNALCPYLSAHRVEKLEKAMRAAKLAGVATGFLGSGLLSGR